MQLYHWKADAYDYLVMSDSLSNARQAILESIQAWEHLDPEKFKRHAEIICSTLPFVAGAGHVIVPRF